MKIINLDAEEIGERELPNQFNEEIRPDLIKRAFLALMSHKRQPYGAKEDAGKRASAKLSRRRRNYKTAYGYGISRAPRKILSRSGTRFNWVGAFAPGTVGGRRAHPPKASKIFWQKINKKERRKAIRSAMAATINKDTAKERGHMVPENYPFIADQKIEALKTAKEVKKVLEKFGLRQELEKTIKKKIRAGKGKSRGRKYRKKRGILIVVSGPCSLLKAAQNIPGVEIKEIKNINVELLAPGAVPGRLTLWSNGAIEILEKRGLFR